MAGTQKVLIAEDDENFRRLYQLIFKKFNIEITLSSNGRDALKIIHSSQFDLIILDISLPGMSGLQIANNIRKTPQYEKVPLVAVTGNTGQEILREIFQAGFDYYFPKPIDTRKFPIVVSQILEGKIPEGTISKQSWN